MRIHLMVNTCSAGDGEREREREREEERKEGGKREKREEGVR